MILLIDNYDSFTFNLYHQIAQFGKDVKVVRNDTYSVDEIRALQPEAIIISPGPGTPSEAGVCIDVIKELHKEFPILGVCLGHQAIGEAFGAEIVRANRIMHGKTSFLQYETKGLFEDWIDDVEVMRYHSLIIKPDTLPNELIVSAVSSEDHEIMAIHHQTYPVYGVQFHPESIGTERGNAMIKSFLNKI